MRFGWSANQTALWGGVCCLRGGNEEEDSRRLVSGARLAERHGEELRRRTAGSQL